MHKTICVTKLATCVTKSTYHIGKCTNLSVYLYCQYVCFISLENAQVDLYTYTANMCALYQWKIHKVIGIRGYYIYTANMCALYQWKMHNLYTYTANMCALYHWKMHNLYTYTANMCALYHWKMHKLICILILPICVLYIIGKCTS